MLWKILRPRYWILDRRIRAMKPAVVIGILLILGYGGQFAYNNFIIPFLNTLASEQAISAVASALPIGLTFFLLFGMLGIGDMMTQLYLASDLELLMVAPIPFRTLYLVKLIQCSRATWVPALMFAAVLTLLGIAQKLPMVYYGLIFLLLLVVILLTTAMVMILVVILARLIPAQKVRTWMPLILILATFAMVMIFPWIMNSLVQENTISFLVGALLDTHKLGLISAGFSGLALLLTFLGFLVFKVSFHEGWDRFNVAPTVRSQRNAAVSRRKGFSRLLNWLPSPLRHFLVKEWLEMQRNPRGPIVMVQPLIILFMLLLPFLSNSNLIRYFSPFLFWFLAITLVMILGIIPLSSIMITVAEEGRRLALIRSAPVKMSVLLKGKFWAAWLPMVLSWTIILSAVGWFLNYSGWQIGYLVLVAGWGLTGVSWITISISGLKVDFSIEEVKQRVSSLDSLLTMSLNFFYMLLTFLGSSWILVRVDPVNPSVDLIRVYSDSAFIGWLFSTSRLIPAILFSVQACMFFGIWYLWNSAVRRLEGWEPGH